MQTYPRQFRFTQDTLDLMDALAPLVGVQGRADVIRVALRSLADQYFGKGKKPPVPSGAGEPTPAPQEKPRRGRKRKDSR